MQLGIDTGIEDYTMFASVEYKHSVDIRLNDGTGASLLLASGKDIAIARQIVDLLNEHFSFTKGLTITNEGLRD